MRSWQFWREQKQCAQGKDPEQEAQETPGHFVPIPFGRLIGGKQGNHDPENP